MFHSLWVSSVIADLSWTSSVQAEEATGAEQWGAGRAGAPGAACTHTHRHTTNGLAPYSSRQWCCREMSVFKWPFLKFGQQQKHLFEEQGTYYANPKKGSPKMFIFLQLHFSTTLFSSMLGFLNRHDSMTVNTCVMSDLFWPVFFLTLASKSMFIGPKPTMWMEHLI